MRGCEGCHDYFQGINLVLYNYLLKIVYLDQYMGGSLVWINGVFIQDTWIQQSVWDCFSFTSAEEFIWKSSISTYSITIVNHVTTGKSIFVELCNLFMNLQILFFYLTTVLISHNSSW